MSNPRDKMDEQREEVHSLKSRLKERRKKEIKEAKDSNLNKWFGSSVAGFWYEVDPKDIDKKPENDKEIKKIFDTWTPEDFQKKSRLLDETDLSTLGTVWRDQARRNKFTLKEIEAIELYRLSLKAKKEAEKPSRFQRWRESFNKEAKEKERKEHLAEVKQKQTERKKSMGK